MLLPIPDAETEAIKLLQRDKFPDFRASSSFENLINLVCNGTYVVDERTMKGAKKIRRKSLDRLAYSTSATIIRNMEIIINIFTYYKYNNVLLSSKSPFH